MSRGSWPFGIGWRPRAIRLAFATLLALPARAEPLQEDVPVKVSAVPRLELPQPIFPQLTDPPRRAVRLAWDGRPPSVLIPVVEVPAIDTTIWLFDLVRGKKYSQISLQSIGHHFSQGDWIWDNDDLIANELGHPFHGTLGFTAARSSGLGFWASIPFAIATSAIWTTVFENATLSRNDLITTPLGGIFLGEVLHRVSLLTLDSGQPTILRWVVATLLEPVGGFNLVFFGRRDSSFFMHPAFFARMMLGGFVNLRDTVDAGAAHVQGTVTAGGRFGVDVSSGLPGDPRWRFRQPFDHYIFSGRFDVSGNINAAVYARGLIAGGQFAGETVSGFGGLYGGYDFAYPNTFRLTHGNAGINTLSVASVNVGLGGAAQVQFTPNLFLLPTVVISGIPFGAAGGLLNNVGDRDYHYGFGLQQLLDLQFVARGVGRVGVVERAYLIDDSVRSEGQEVMLHVSSFAEFLLNEHNGVGVEAFFGNRNATFNGAAPNAHQVGVQVSVYWTLQTDGSFGAVPREER